MVKVKVVLRIKLYNFVVKYIELFIYCAGVAQLARASAFQADCREFESRLPLHYDILIVSFHLIFTT
jgi:hypothetical protein